MANCLVYIWNAFIKFLWGIFKHGVKVFEKSGMDFQFEHIKAQHTGIWCLLVQCFLGQCSVWTAFGKQILLGHFQLRSESLGAERYGDLIQTYQSTTYWNLVTNREVFAGAGFCVDSFWKTICFGGISKYGVKVFEQSVINI